MVKNILNSDTESVQSMEVPTPRPRTTRYGSASNQNVTSSGYGMTKSFPAKSEPDLSGNIDRSQFATRIDFEILMGRRSALWKILVFNLKIIILDH